MRIFVGNLSYETTEDELRAQFGAFGEVSELKIMNDRDTGRPKGFAFLEMPSKSQAIAAISGMNGKTLNERALTVNEARPRNEGGSGGRGGYGQGGGNRGSWDKGGGGGRGRGRY